MFRFCLLVAFAVALVAQVGTAEACPINTQAGCAPQASFAPTCGQAPVYTPGPIVAYAPAPVFFQPAHVVLQREVRLKEVRQRRFQRDVQIQRNVVKHR
jgi:hypothetical protein